MQLSAVNIHVIQFTSLLSSTNFGIFYINLYYSLN